MTLREKIAAAFVLVQVLFFAGWAAFEQARLQPGAGRAILVKVVPVDPRDLLSGQYLNLTYAFSRVNTTLVRGDLPDEGNTVWVVLRERDGFFEPVSMSKAPPKDAGSGDVVIRGTVDRWLRVDCGDIERCYVPEGTRTPDSHDLTVRLRVGGDHVPRIEKVYLKGQPWP